MTVLQIKRVKLTNPVNITALEFRLPDKESINLKIIL